MLEDFLVLAARPVWGRFDHQRPGFDATHLWVVLGVLAAIIGASIAAYRSSRRGKSDFDCDSHAKLFRELCRAHQLSFASRRLLRRLALALEIAEPARLFLEPKHFNPAHLPESLQSAAVDVARLRERLFPQ